MSHDPLVLGIIGFGYWGPKLVRNFTAFAGTRVKTVADRLPARRQAARAAYPSVRAVGDAKEVIGDPEIDAVAVATPLYTHFPIARAALEAKKHVLVEKPLASSLAECEELVAVAEQNRCILMVDHTFLYTGAVRKVRDIIAGQTLGRVLYFDSVRINLGLFQPDFNVVWDLAPHDLSIMDFVLDSPNARWVSAVGASHYGKHENLAYVTVGFDDGLMAHVHCNWVAPVKTRRITIAGTDRMLVYDDVEPSEKVKLYDSGVDVTDIDKLDSETVYQMNVQYRTGDVLVPKIDQVEALSLVVEDFATSCRSGRPPTASAATGLRVVRLLEAAQRSITNRGARVEV